MTARRNRMIALLCLMALLAGCGKKEAAPIGSEVWDEMPALTYGVMEYDKLEVLPWNSGRCEATSFYTMAETEDGCYLLAEYFHKLYYADKSNLKDWVMVCNKPECDHWHAADCDATLDSWSILAHNDRLYFEQLTGRYDLYQSKGMGKIIVSMARDGTDRKQEYVLEDALLTTEGGSHSLLTPEHWLYSTYSLDTDGSMKTRFFRVTKDGATEYPVEQSPDNTNTGIYWIGKQYLLYGDEYFDIALLDNDGSVLAGKAYRFESDEPATLDMPLLLNDSQYAGGYISDEILRTFRINDGYYDRNLKTGETMKLADARLENSGAYMVLPNCIIETTLHQIAASFRPEGIKHSMEFFDGQTWRQVTLPPELVSAGQNDYLAVQAVTSDSVLFIFHKDGDFGRLVQLYSMSVAEEDLKLTHMVTLTHGE